MRPAPAALALALGLALGGAACGGGAHPGGSDAGPADAQPDAAPPPWWHPAPGEARDWDIQLAAPIDTSAPRAMYDLDLWSLVPAPTVLDYGDGKPVTVPAGPLAGTIAALHARTPRAVVVCHVDTGALELGRPDAPKFPGYEASPPDRPTPPKPGSVIGWSSDRPGERFLDLSEAHRGAFEQLIWKRLDLAVQIGCDAVDADRNDVVTSDPGFTISPMEQGTWYAAVASQAHQRLLSVGMRNANELPGAVDNLAGDFDWMIVERCGEYDDCDTTRPFTSMVKPVFAIDYQLDAQAGTGVDPTIACTRQKGGLIMDGLVKDGAVSSAFRVQCTP